MPPALMGSWAAHWSLSCLPPSAGAHFQPLLGPLELDRVKPCVGAWVLSHFSRIQPFVTPRSSVPGILQARILEWVVMPFSRESSHLSLNLSETKLTFFRKPKSLRKTPILCHIQCDSKIRKPWLYHSIWTPSLSEFPLPIQLTVAPVHLPSNPTAY